MVSDFNHVSGRQIASARVLLELGQVELANLAKISAPTLRRMEASKGAMPGMHNNIAAVIAALEAAGITFLANGEVSPGPGVALRDRQGD